MSKPEPVPPKSTFMPNCLNSSPSGLPGQKVFIDPAVLVCVDACKPSGMSRTSWVNYLVQLGLLAADQQRQQQPDA